MVKTMRLFAPRKAGEHRVEPGTEARHQVQDVVCRDQRQVVLAHEYLAILFTYSQRRDLAQDLGRRVYLCRNLAEVNGRVDDVDVARPVVHGLVGHQVVDDMQLPSYSSERRSKLLRAGRSHRAPAEKPQQDTATALSAPTSSRLEASCSIQVTSWGFAPVPAFNDDKDADRADLGPQKRTRRLHAKSPKFLPMMKSGDRISTGAPG